MADTDGRPRTRMSGRQRREQLLRVGRAVFAERGFDGASIEEVAARAEVSKPVVYEHFGGKEGLYAVVVDREMTELLGRLTAALASGTPRVLAERAALALLTYIDEQTDGFRILSRDASLGGTAFASLLNDIAHQVEHVLAHEFEVSGMGQEFAAMYAQMLVGMVAVTGTWWLEERSLPREVVAAHITNLGWNGLAHLQRSPSPIGETPDHTGA